MTGAAFTSTPEIRDRAEEWLQNRADEWLNSANDASSDRVDESTESKVLWAEA